MTTSFRPLAPLRTSDVFDGRLEEHGVFEYVSPMLTTDACRCLTDGRSALWVFADEGGLITAMVRGHRVDLAEVIVAAIRREFDVVIVNSQSPRYYGFATQEEMDAAEAEAKREYWDELYPELIAYVRGEPSRIEPGAGSERHAKLACELVADDVSLLWPENRERFIEAVQKGFARRHAPQTHIRSMTQSRLFASRPQL